jgi:hypothetical protein
MRSGPRAWEEGLTRATLNAADRGRVSSKPYINTATVNLWKKVFCSMLYSVGFCHATLAVDTSASGTATTIAVPFVSD